MKRITIYVIFLSILTLFVATCSNNKENYATIILPIISLESTGEKINPSFYEDDFDFNYDNLPILASAGNEDVLQIKLSEDFSDKVVIGENYYHYAESTETIYSEIYELDKDDNNIVLLPIKRRGNEEDEQAVYFILNDNKMKFVFKVILPIDKID